ncbi:Ig-like domain-containing protein [Acinetobacter amyesii]|uniref:Ig-like domain-containing protein n=1 Tax=Acinetobacter amyesii TaxID=2942470 RepID=UPI0020C0D2CB|nr:Ig-like domain-containing protein [Acinetobacter amyesii]MCL6232695.1 Ig-like domain-containing protein [Acinetobacter amyesii]
MTKIVVISKKDQTILKETQATKIQISQPSVIQLELKPADIQSIHRVGNQCVITLKNGQKIVIDDFYTDDFGSDNSLLVHSGPEQFELVEMDVDGKTVSYRSVNEFAQPLSASTQLNQATTPAQATEVASEDDGSPSLLKAGLAILGAEAVYLLAFDKEDDKSSSNDKTAPSTPTGSFDSDGKVVSGKAEVGATVYIVDAKGNTIGQSKADADGNYKITLDDAITDGNRVILYAKDKAGNSSQSMILTGSKDTIAPDAANAQVDESGKFISGLAEAGSKVYVYAADGTTLLGGPVTAASDGNFSIALSDTLQAGETAKVIVEDKAGNKSEAQSVEMGKDTLRPDQPKIEVNKAGTELVGTAEANSTIQILDANLQVIATTTVDANGQFKLTLSPALSDSNKTTIIVVDAAGNQSISLNVTAGTDNTAPVAPTATINTDGTEVSGSAEIGAKITIKNSAGNTLGTATVGDDGRYTVKLSSAITDNNIVQVTATDAAGNSSKSTQVIGTKDTIAPSAPTLTTVYDDRETTKLTIKQGESTQDSTPSFEGKGEANATITIYKNGVAVATVKADTSGKWLYTPESDLAAGKYSYSFTQTDLAGNTSAKSSAFDFTVEAMTVAKASLFLISEEQASNELHDQASQLVDDNTVFDVLAQHSVSGFGLNEISSFISDDQIDLNSLLSNHEPNIALDEISDDSSYLYPSINSVSGVTAVSNTELQTAWGALDPLDQTLNALPLY